VSNCTFFFAQTTDARETAEKDCAYWMLGTYPTASATTRLLSKMMAHAHVRCELLLS